MRPETILSVAFLIGGPLGSLVLAAPGDVLAILKSPNLGAIGIGGEIGRHYLAVSGTDVLVSEAGSYLLDDDGEVVPAAGTVYLFDGTSGELRFEIPNPNPRRNGNFGRGLTIQAGRIFAGIRGRAFAFDIQSSELLFEIIYSGPSRSAGFGRNMAPLGEDRVVIASNLSPLGALPNPSRLNVIDADTGDFLLEIPYPEPNVSGVPLASARGLATLDNKIIAGSFLHDPFEDPDTPTPGAAFVFDGDTGELLFRLDNPSPESTRDPGGGHLFWFGRAVGATHDKFIVGAHGMDIAGLRSSGAAYVFDAHDGSLRFTIPNPNPQAWAEFGYSVAGVGHDILVTAPRVVNWDQENASSGAAYLFDGDTGELLMEIANPGDGWSSFGYTVTSMGNDLVIGAPGGLADGSRGAVYIIEGLPERIPGDTNRDGRVDSTDLTTLLLNWTGALEVGEGGKLFNQGDFNYDRSVDSSDLTILLTNWTGADGSAPQLALTPEPGGLAMFALALLLMRPHGRAARPWRRQ